MGPALPCVNAGIFPLTGANIGIKSGFLQRMWEKNVIFVELNRSLDIVKVDFQRVILIK